MNKRPSGCSSERDWAVHNLSRPSFGNSLYKLVLSAAIYHVVFFGGWVGGREMHTSSTTKLETGRLFRSIEGDVRNRRCSRKVENSYSNGLL